MNVVRSVMEDPRLLRTVAGALLLALAVCVLCYVYRMGSPLIRGDDWRYTVTIVKSYFDGHLGIMDFFTKHGPGENAQPINRLILLGLVKWFQMDFSVQGMLGGLIALTCVVLLTALAWREPSPLDRPEWARTVLPLGLGAVILSLNASGDYSWPLVTTLVYTGTFGISLYLYFASSLSEKGAWLRLGLLTFAVLVLLDTFATLAVLAVVLLILARVPGSVHRWRTAATGLAALVSLLIYQHVFTWLTGTSNSPLEMGNMLAAATYLVHHVDEAWKVLVAPFGAALFEPPPSMRHPWLIMSALAVPLWALHVWFWRNFLRRRGDRIAFLSAGLMLYSYATVAGMLVDRIPQHGFDYLLQPRYVAFYQLQLVAMLLMWSRLDAPRVTVGTYAGWTAAACSLLLALTLASGLVAWHAERYVDKYNQRVVAQIQALAEDPAHPPPDCLPDITPCHWPEASRRQVLQILQDHKLNVFSAAVRDRHGYVWQETAQAY